MKCREGRSILACPAAQKPLALIPARGQEFASGEHPKLWRCAFFDSAQIRRASGQNAVGTGPASLPSNRITANATEGQTYYIHADHLDTPRQITDTQGNVVWRWDNTDPFGNNMPNDNPNGAGQFSFNLRFPGQYADKETNTYYNVNRDYDPALGRYVESDPIGLAAGINTYTYVNGNPLSYFDPTGNVAIAPVVVWGFPILAGAAWAALNLGARQALTQGWEALITWAKPPENAYDPNGPQAPKAPGKPGKEEGFCEPKGDDDWVKNPNGRGSGWRDKGGDVWVPTGPFDPSKGDSHGGSHWDVQTPGGGYVNVYPGGARRP